MSTTTWDLTTADNVGLSNGDLTATNTVSSSIVQGVKVATASGKASGKYYYEITCVTRLDRDDTFGVCLPAAIYSNLYFDATGGVTAYTTGRIYTNGFQASGQFNGFDSGDTMGVAVDLDNRNIWVKVVAGPDAPDSWNGDPGANPATNTGGIAVLAGTIVPFCTFGGTNGDVLGNVFTANFGASTFAGTIPSGFTEWTSEGVNVAQNPDLDKGGTFRQYMKVWMGPSVGWLSMPFETVFPITVAGTYTLERWTNLVQINVAGNITINLPSSKASSKGPQAIPGQWVLNPVTIVDIGGHSASFTYTIVPTGAELISGLSSVTLAANFGSLILEPLLEAGGWNLIQ